MAGVRYNASAVQRRLAETRKRLRDLEPVLKPRAALLQGIMLKAYTARRGPNGEQFAPLAKSTLKRPRTANVPLVKSGRMRGTTQAVAEKKRIVFGFGVPYAKYHHTASGRMHRPIAPMDQALRPLFAAGSALKWWRDTRRAVAEYIAGKRNG